MNLKRVLSFFFAICFCVLTCLNFSACEEKKEESKFDLSKEATTVEALDSALIVFINNLKVAYSSNSEQLILAEQQLKGVIEGVSISIKSYNTFIEQNNLSESESELEENENKYYFKYDESKIEINKTPKGDWHSINLGSKYSDSFLEFLIIDEDSYAGQVALKNSDGTYNIVQFIFDGTVGKLYISNYQIGFDSIYGAELSNQNYPNLESDFQYQYGY